MNTLSTTKNTVTFVSSIIDYLFRISATNKNGLVKGLFSVSETRSGGVTVRHSESVAKSFIDRLRRETNKANNTSISFLEVCQVLANAGSFDEILTFTVDKAGQRVDLDEKTRNQRLRAFGTRISKAFAPVIGKELDGSVSLTNTQMLDICRSAASFYVATSQAYVAPVKKPVIVKKADKKAVVGKGRAKNSAKRIERAAAM